MKILEIKKFKRSEIESAGLPFRRFKDCTKEITVSLHGVTFRLSKTEEYWSNHSRSSVSKSAQAEVPVGMIRDRMISKGQDLSSLNGLEDDYPIEVRLFWGDKHTDDDRQAAQDVADEYCSELVALEEYTKITPTPHFRG